MSWYKSWLYESMIEDDFPWEEATEITFSEFEQAYTLHDSLWIGLFQDVSYEDTTILAIDWDTVWLPDGLKSHPNITKNVFLFIKMFGTKQVCMSGYEDIGKLQRGIGEIEIIKEGNTWFVIISDHYGGEVQIHYSGVVKFLSLNDNKEVIPIYPKGFGIPNFT